MTYQIDMEDVKHHFKRIGPERAAEQVILIFEEIQDKLLFASIFWKKLEAQKIRIEDSAANKE